MASAFQAETGSVQVRHGAFGHGDASNLAGPAGDTSGNGRDEVRVLAGRKLT